LNLLSGLLGGDAEARLLAYSPILLEAMGIDEAMEGAGLVGAGPVNR
jgi:hypothetical protein